MALGLRIVVDQRVWSFGFCEFFFLMWLVLKGRGGFGLILWVAGVGGCHGLVCFFYLFCGLS